VREQLLLNLVDFLEGSDTLLEDGEDGRDDFLGGRAVLGPLVVTNEKVDVEQWDLSLWGAHLLDLLLGVEGVMDIERVLNHTANWYEVTDCCDESLNRVFGHVLEGVLHDELGLSKELLEFAHLVGLLGGLVEAVPWSTELLSLGRILGKVGLDDVLDLVDPGLLEIVGDLTSGRALNLLELTDSHRLGDVGVVDVLLKDVVALLADLLHGTD